MVCLATRWVDFVVNWVIAFAEAHWLSDPDATVQLWSQSLQNQQSENTHTHVHTYSASVGEGLWDFKETYSETETWWPSQAAKRECVSWLLCVCVCEYTAGLWCLHLWVCLGKQPQVRRWQPHLPSKPLHPLDPPLNFLALQIFIQVWCFPSFKESYQVMEPQSHTYKFTFPHLVFIINPMSQRSNKRST